MTQKSFFKKRTVPQIRKLEPIVARNAQGLVDKILRLDAASQAIQLTCNLLPYKFRRRSKTNKQANVDALKHGEYIRLAQPTSPEGAMDMRWSPTEVRRETLDNTFRYKRELEIEAMGYEFVPLIGRDLVPRRIPFVRVVDAARLFAYAQTQTKDGIKVDPLVDAARVEIEGGMVLGSVPSKRKGEERYRMAAYPIPIFDTDDQFAIAYGFRTDGARVPEHKTYLFGYNFKSDAEGSQRITLNDKDGALMMGIANHFMLEEENTVPRTQNMFASPSLLTARFDTKLQNNVIIYDPTLSGGREYRHLHLAERSMLIARLIGSVGHDNALRRVAGRDPKLAEYDWHPPTK